MQAQVRGASGATAYDTIMRLGMPALLVSGVIGFQLLGPVALRHTYAGLAIWALTSSKNAIRALSLMWIPGLLNPDLFDFGFRLIWWGSQSYLVLKWSVLLAAFLGCALR